MLCNNVSVVLLDLLMTPFQVHLHRQMQRLSAKVLRAIFCVDGAWFVVLLDSRVGWQMQCWGCLLQCWGRFSLLCVQKQHVGTVWLLVIFFEKCRTAGSLKITGCHNRTQVQAVSTRLAIMREVL